MKKRIIGAMMAAVSAISLAACGNEGGNVDSAGEPGNGGSEASGQTFKVGIVQYVDDASLNQIEKAIEAELDAKGAELGVTFNYADYTFNGQADATMLNQIATQLVEDKVDVIVPIATPTALIMQSATEENKIPVVFSAVSDPITAGLVADLNAPGANITGTSDSLNTTALMDLMFAADADIDYVGLLYNKSEDASTKPIEEAKAYLDAKGVNYIEKTGTTNEEVALAADALVAEGVDAVFTPTDNTIMTAELAIYEKFKDAGIAHYAGADSFALNGAFCGYGVDYTVLGTETADMVVEILMNGKEPASMPVRIMDNGIASVNTEVAAALGLDYSVFNGMCTQVVELTTAENFE